MNPNDIPISHKIWILNNEISCKFPEKEYYIITLMGIISFQSHDTDLSLIKKMDLNFL